MNDESLHVIQHSSFIILLRSRVMKRCALLLFAFPLFAAPRAIDQKTFDAIAAEYSGEHAQELERRIVEYHRIQGSSMMESVAKDVILPALKSANVEASIEQSPVAGSGCAKRG